MVDRISGIRFQGNPLTLNKKQEFKPSFSATSKLLGQPIKDEVSFTGATIDIKKMKQIIKVLGLELQQTGGRHPMKIVGQINGKMINSPFSLHGKKELATGTANAIAKQLGFSNTYDMLNVLKKAA